MAKTCDYGVITCTLHCWKNLWCIQWVKKGLYIYWRCTIEEIGNFAAHWFFTRVHWCPPKLFQKQHHLNIVFSKNYVNFGPAGKFSIKICIRYILLHHTPTKNEHEENTEWVKTFDELKTASNFCKICPGIIKVLNFFIYLSGEFRGLGDEGAIFSLLSKVPFSSDKQWDFERPNLGTDSKNLAKHPPKMVG